MTSNNLEKIHIELCHPGVTRMLHFVKSKNLPYSIEEVKKVCSTCRGCAELKPKFYRPQQPGNLIKATQPMERLIIDFKGPLPTTSRNAYLLTVVDEYSRFPFAFPCPNMQSSTVITCLDQIFTLCGMPNYIHSDLGTSFLSRELKDYLTKRGIATSNTTPYHPIGNGQVERYNGIIWKAVRLALRSANLPQSRWELVLADALHSIRSLLCTSTNATPHERFFNFQRRSSSGVSLPSWMQPGPVLLRRFVRTSKNDPLVDEVELTDVNPTYARIRYPDGRESSVSLRDLTPCPSPSIQKGTSPETRPLQEPFPLQEPPSTSLPPARNPTLPSQEPPSTSLSPARNPALPLPEPSLISNGLQSKNVQISEVWSKVDDVEKTGPRRSTRESKPPTRYGW